MSISVTQRLNLRPWLCKSAKALFISQQVQGLGQAWIQPFCQAILVSKPHLQISPFPTRNLQFISDIDEELAEDLMVGPVGEMVKKLMAEENLEPVS